MPNTPTDPPGGKKTPSGTLTLPVAVCPVCAKPVRVCTCCKEQLALDLFPEATK